MENNKRGIIFIPDISGFTRFVNSIDLETVKKIISMLLAIIMHENNLGLKVAEIEGDAIVFYQYGSPIDVSLILEQFDDMLTAFYAELNALQFVFPQVKALSLKLIVHYGPLSDFSLGGFTKLYGAALLEAHQLLKNNVGQDCYVLITASYLEAVAEADNPMTTHIDQLKNLSQFKSYLGQIDYTCFPIAPPALDNYWVG